ncbi:MAG: methyl-accepting chemotaxis protein [Acidobacteriota bacterium]|nr:methyl-accepting chemotaxis protein [Acidobacteriota bacterium]
MNIRTKFALKTLLVTSTMLLSTLVVDIRVREANRLSDQLVSQHIPVVADLRDIRDSSTNSVQALQGYLLFGIDPRTAATFSQQRRQSTQATQAALADLIRRTQDMDMGEDRSRLASVLSSVNALGQLEEHVESLNEAHGSDGTAQAYNLLRNDILSTQQSLSAELAELTRSQMAKVDSESTRLRQQNSSVLWTVWVLTAFCVVLGWTVALMLGSKIGRNLGAIMRRSEAIAAGDLTGEPLNIECSDETGSLAVAMNQMQDNLAGILGTVVDTSSSLTQSAATMRGASDKIHRRIDQQSQQTQQAATAMQEMSASIAEVSNHTQTAAEAARNAAQTARDGGMIVKEVLNNIHSIANAVSETSTTVTVLGEDSHRISQIVTVIDEIARKTNLLALNAAIEAARAGDHGKGFAVVAGEVRRLAESTAQATGEIAGMIQGIQERTRVAIAGMEAGTTTVENGVATTNQAGEALKRIIGMAEQVDRMITQIAVATSQQSAAANESSASLDAIHTLSHDNLGEMATTAAGIESLRDTAVTLQEQVDRFQLATGQQASKSVQRGARGAMPGLAIHQPA